MGCDRPSLTVRFLRSRKKHNFSFAAKKLFPQAMPAPRATGGQPLRAAIAIREPFRECCKVLIKVTVVTFLFIF